jgi:hypothetical protein
MVREAKAPKTHLGMQKMQVNIASPLRLATRLQGWPLRPRACFQLSTAGSGFVECNFLRDMANG